MNPTIVAVFASLTVAFSGIAGFGAYQIFADEPDAAHLDGHDAHAAEAGKIYGFDVGIQRLAWPEVTSSPPSASAASALEEIHHLELTRDDAFTPSNGVRSGSGTPADPFVISGYHVTGDLYLQDTTQCVEIRDNYVAGQLSLNYIGDCVFVHSNHIDDLRVNENIKRVGAGTTGLITGNTIEFVGQIRHFDGVFSHNTVGPYQPDSMWDTILETTLPGFQGDLRVMNVDGYNQGWFDQNEFFGSVEIDLHGHHHSTGWTADHSHHHDAERAAMAKAEDDANETGGHQHDAEAGPMMHDHTNRWNQVFFTNNVITDPEGFGLRIEDRNHRGDDVRANSEQEPQLEMPHTHHTRIVVAGNHIDGAPLWVDVFNADDKELHLERSPGEVHILDNTVVLPERSEEGWLGLFWFGSAVDASSAISIYAAKEVETFVTGNRVTFEPATDKNEPLLPFFGPEPQLPTAIHIDGIRDATLTLANNKATGFTYGVLARDLDAATSWHVYDNDFGSAQYPVWYDESVANEPLEHA